MSKVYTETTPISSELNRIDLVVYTSDISRPGDSKVFEANAAFGINIGNLYGIGYFKGD